MKITNGPIRLGDFIINNMENILQEWEDFAKTIQPPAQTMDRLELRDHAELMLKRIAYDLSTYQSEKERSDKSKGLARESESETPAHEHAEARLKSSFTMAQLFSEYRALRSSVLHLWSNSTKEGLITDSVDIMRFNEAVDQAIAESVAKYCALIKTSQDMFLGILSHDLRNPLNTIIMSSIILLQYSELSVKVKTLCQRMFNSSQRMNKLINDLTDYTRSQFYEILPTVLAPANIGSICEDIIHEHKTSNPSREFVLHKLGSLNGIWDKERISQVFSNLLGNAVQHGCPLSPIEVELIGLNEQVKVKITNKGPVITKNRIKTIFEPLSRYDHADNENMNKNSLGLGLYITREIILAHKGNISVMSSEDLGTTFSFEIPRDSSTS